jgi:hypothetical protein
MEWKLQWTDYWLTKREFETSLYSRFRFRDGELWPDSNNPIFYFISRHDTRYANESVQADVQRLLRAPAHYAPHLRCLLGDIALALSALNFLSIKNLGEWDYRHAAIGSLLKYHDNARDKIFDEIRELMGDQLFFSPLDVHQLPKTMEHVRLPTMDEWIIKRKLGIHRQDVNTLTAEQMNEFRGKNVLTLDFGPAVVREQDLFLLKSQDSISEQLATPNCVEHLLTEPWLEEFRNIKPMFAESDEFDDPWNGVGLSYWKGENASALLLSQYLCLLKARHFCS